MVDYNYNNRGEVTGIARLGNAPDQVLTYDDFGRLATTGWTQGGAQAATWSFTRNPASQIRTEGLTNALYSWNAHPAGTSTAAYQTNGLNQYTQVGANGVCHDANGNLTRDGTWAYQYDVENRPSSGSGGADARAGERHALPHQYHRLWRGHGGAARIRSDGAAV